MFRVLLVAQVLALVGAVRPATAHAQGAEPAALASGSVGEGQLAGRSVLFVGNSYTHYNGLPGTVAAFARMASPEAPWRVRAHTVGGATLARLWHLPTTPDVLGEAAWTHIVLQEQSRLPMRAPERLVASVQLFAPHARASGAQLVLYLTWPRQGRPQDQAALTEAYTRAARAVGAVVAPVGPAWALAMTEDPDLNLYAPDGSHPSPAGSYIAACTLFLAIAADRVECPPLPGDDLTPAQADVARRAAVKAMAEMRRDWPARAPVVEQR